MSVEIGYVLLGLGTGTIAVVVGVGGGVIYVPALTTLFDFTQKDAQGTSLSVIAPAAVVATIANSQAGRVAWRIGGIIAVGAFVGAIGGSRLAQSLDEEILRRMFAALLIITAVRMMRRAVRN